MTPSPLPSSDLARLLLRVAEQANSQADFQAVLAATHDALQPLVQLRGLGVVTVEGDVGRIHSIYGDGVEQRQGDTFRDLAERFHGRPLADDELPPEVLPLAGTCTEYVGRTGEPYVCDDVAARQRFVEERWMVQFGIRAYVRVPLSVHGRFLGSMMFCADQPSVFGDDLVHVLMLLAPSLATAVAHSMALEKIQQLSTRLELENVALREEIDARGMFEEIVGESAEIREVMTLIERVAPTQSTVLLTGETGTGKELVARALHRRSGRAGRPLISVNCGALPDTLLASELFGHEKGAFTGATARRTGRFELADGGTLFLDEIGELSAETQAALLRVLQEQRFERVGGTQTLRTDVRVIAATNRDLHAEEVAGRFRADLFYRLHVFPIALPPLRARPSDIPLLVDHFVHLHGQRQGKRFESVDRHSLAWMAAYDWPGNVRELENVLERAVILGRPPVLHVEEPRRAAVPVARKPASSGAGAPASLRDHERQAIEDALARSRGRVSGPRGAATLLGLHANTLESKIKRLGIDKFRYRSAGASTSPS